MLAAYQRSHAGELQAMIASLPLQPGDYVLDMACGAGTYTCWLADRVGPQGNVVGVDIDPTFLAVAGKAVAAAGGAERVSLCRSDIAGLPFDDNSFDLAWCAQSLYTLPDPLAALRELRRVVRPGGTVAVFENDTVHQIILPWPPDLELAVRQAQLQSFHEDSPSPERFYIGRDFCTAFHDIGIDDCRITAHTSVRHAPLDANERTFLAWYLHELSQRACPFLNPVLRARFKELIDPSSSAFMLNSPDFYVTYIDLLACGTKSLAE
jgi:SAM-dependent methyltransferase